MARGRHVKPRPGRSGRWSVLMVVTTMVVGTTAAVAQTDADDTYTGCLTRSGDILNVAVGDTPAKDCRSHLQIQWNSRGVKGDPGPTGPQGPAGGMLGTYVRTNSADIGPNGGGLMSAFCDSGDTVTGGGFRAGGLRIDESYPGAPSSQRWIVIATNETDQWHQLEVYVVCGDLTQ